MTQTQTTVSHSAPPPANNGAPPSQTPPHAPAFDPKEFQSQLNELKTALAEKDRAIEFWQEKATKAAPAPKAEAEEPEEDPDLLDVVTGQGVKGLEKILEKKGFVRRADVDATVQAKAAELAKERELMETYPELSNRNSEFFKTTAMHYGTLLKAGVSPAVAMELSAEKTALTFLREGKMKTPQQESEERKTRREEERRARINAQGGDKGVRTPQASEEDEELTPEQKHIARAMGITEEAYKARAAKGVAMRGVR
jgi:hypothetical protein